MRKYLGAVTPLISLAFFAATANAGSFSIEPLSNEQQCECDCFMGLWLAGQRNSSTHPAPLIFVETGGHAEIHINGHPIGLDRKETNLPFVSADGKTSVVTNLNFRPIADSEVGAKSVTGTLTISYGGRTRTIAIQGHNECE